VRRQACGVASGPAHKASLERNPLDQELASCTSFDRFYCLTVRSDGMYCKF